MTKKDSPWNVKSPAATTPKKNGVGWGAFSSLGVGILAYVAPQIVLGVIVAMAAVSTDVEPIEFFETASPAFIFGISLLTNFLGGLGVWWYVRNKGGLRALGFRNTSLRYYLYVIPAYIVYIVALLVTLSVVEQVAPAVDLDQEQDLGIGDVVSVAEHLFTFLTLVFLPPLFEELLFRGFIFQGIAKKYGFWMGALLVSALFGLAHGQLNVGIDTFILGMVASWLVWQSKSLYPAILLHAIKNGVAFYVLFICGEQCEVDV